MIILYEPLGLQQGHKLLEIGLGTGYSVVVAREIVGPEGLVVSVEIDPEAYENGKRFVQSSGFDNIILVQGDGCLGYQEMSPYDRICITAACGEIPPLLIEQLKIGGKLIAPVVTGDKQEIVLLEKTESGVTKEIIRNALYNIPYVPMTGKYGIRK